MMALPHQSRVTSSFLLCISTNIRIRWLIAYLQLSVRSSFWQSHRKAAPRCFQLVRILEASHSGLGPGKKSSALRSGGILVVVQLECKTFAMEALFSLEGLAELAAMEGCIGSLQRPPHSSYEWTLVDSSSAGHTAAVLYTLDVGGGSSSEDFHRPRGARILPAIRPGKQQSVPELLAQCSRSKSSIFFLGDEDFVLSE